MFALAGCVQLACSVLLATLCLVFFFLRRFHSSHPVFYNISPFHWPWSRRREHKYAPICKICQSTTNTGVDGEHKHTHKTGLLGMERPGGNPHRSHPFQQYPQHRPANPQTAVHPRPANAQSTQPRPATPHPAHPQPPLNYPQPTRPQPVRPQPMYPHPNNPPPTNPQPTRPQPTYPHPTNPQPTYPRPANPQPPYPHLANPYPTPHSTHPRPTPNPRPPSAHPPNPHLPNAHPSHPLPPYQSGPPDDDPDDLPDAQQQPNADRRSRRSYLQKIALSTVEAINNGIVDVSKTVRRTRLYHPDSPELAEWQYPPRQSWYAPNRNPPNILVLGMSTLQGAAYFHSAAFEASMGTGTATGTTTVTDTTVTASTAPKRIGVLNFASATQPGGGFLDGARAQEESLARSSTLYVSLTTPTARPFYALHAKDSGGGFYSHSMIYSPNVHIFRDDAGAWVPPHQVDILTSPAVNAAHVRRAHRFRQIPPQQLEAHILEVMRERMARILALFEREGAKNLVLGSFGTGVFKNDVKGVARVWRELVVGPAARFGRSFENVAFMVPDDETRAIYEAVLNPRRGRRNSNL